MSSYSYSPIIAQNPICLLWLIPGQEGDLLRGSLEEVGLADVKFEALSYCGGVAKDINQDNFAINHAETPTETSMRLTRILFEIGHSPIVLHCVWTPWSLP
jgi:hypothetical protein